MFSDKRSNWLIARLVLIGAMVLLLPASLLAGTTGKISGVVLDASTEEVLPGANILIVGTNMGAAADVDGFFYILNLPPGEYSVQAVMMGYGTTTQQEVVVNVDRTTSLEFKLNKAVLDMGEEIVVTADRPAVELDVSTSTISFTPAEMTTVPKAQLIESLELFPGIELHNMEELEVRGGRLDQISFQVDGFERTDGLNQLAYTTSLNSANIQEIQVLTGVFNAEYGNARSGVFNIVTKEGGSVYGGSVDVRVAPAHQKHFGPNAYDSDQYDYWLYDRAASMNEITNIEGTVLWQGWNAEAVSRNASGWKDKNDWTAQQLQEVWRFRHRPRDYADKPDVYVDAGFGGPVPGLENLNFFAGIKYMYEPFPLPAATHHYDNYTTDLKLTWRPTSSMKLMLLGSYGEVETMAGGWNWNALHGLEVTAVGGGLPQFHGDEHIIGTGAANRGEGEWGANRFNLWGNIPLTTYNSQFGLKFTHSLSPSTFYELRLDRFRSKIFAEHGPESPLDIVKTINGVGFDDGAYGGWLDSEHVRAEVDLPGVYELGGGALVHDYSYSVSTRAHLDFSSQVTVNHLIKTGLEYQSDDINKDHRRYKQYLGTNQHYMQYNEKPYRISGYIQDRMEYGGMIANIGLRLDYFDANGPIWTPEPGKEFSGLWSRGVMESVYETLDDIPTEEAEAHTRLSPRVGISHPIGESTKFFFNYGHFYSTVPPQYRFGLFLQGSPYGPPGAATDPIHPDYTEGTEIRGIPNPDLEPPKTTQFEVGYEQSIEDMYLLRLTAYSKDNAAQIMGVNVFNFAGFTFGHGGPMPGGQAVAEADVDTYRNFNYQDIRGFEVKLSKVRGDWWTGWIHFDYKIITKGNQGFNVLYENPLQQNVVPSAFQQKAEPIPDLKANFSLHTPSDWGAWQGDWTLNILQTWQKGSKYIYNPEGVPIQEVRTIYYWANSYYTNLRLTKRFSLAGLNFQAYMDINNLFNYEKLNSGALSGNEWEKYIEQVVDKLGNKIGDEESMKTLTENWTDVEGNAKAPIAPWRDWVISLYPRNFLFGLKVEL